MNWDTLSRLLDERATAKRRALFWWRDDDAATPTPDLQRLLDLRRAYALPLALAVIPNQASAELAGLLQSEPDVAVLQHGFAHINHGAAGEKKSEFPASRPASDCLADLRRGREILRGLFGPRLRPVLVPPWNRIAPALLPHLPRLGLHGLSTFKAREDSWAAPGLMQVNTHLDPVNWKADAGFIGLQGALDTVLLHLRNDSDEPLGLLTHHARHDAETWDFIAVFLAKTGSHPGALWLDVDSAFGAGPQSGQRA
ncbi:polysaccharide deacetylase family protein [Ferrovibrio sp.]|uniref:polysaccharide deacetylase family protein n=1 Tax=Ferrovibrio sp. TaxID=1917215 RepID=UPI0035AFA248